MKSFTAALVIFLFSASLFAQNAKNGSDSSAEQKTTATAEQKAPESFYKLVFAIYELKDGNRVNQRDYSVIGKINSTARISITTRVPVYMEEKKVQYMRAGLSIDCNLKDHSSSKVAVLCNLNVSSYTSESQIGRLSDVGAPYLRETEANGWDLLTLGKPSLLTSIDDINSNRRTQVEVTATKVD